MEQATEHGREEITMALKAGYKGLKQDQVDKMSAAAETVDAIKCTETTAGSYVLTATVDADGNITYSWESTT